MHIERVTKAMALLLAAAFALSGCSSMSMDDGLFFEDQEPQELTLEELQQPEEYRLAAEDVLQVRVWGVPEFEGNQAEHGISAGAGGLSYVIHGNGAIDLPLIGSIMVAGDTLPEAQDKITAAMRKYMEEPRVSLTVIQYNSRKILILGEVVKPGIVQNPGPMLSLAECLAQAGGLALGSADSRNVYIIRGVLGEPKVRKVDVHTAIGMFQAQHIWLARRDVVYVDSQLITDWNRFMSQLLPTVANAYLLKNIGLVK